jgi:hypothetical protein
MRGKPQIDDRFAKEILALIEENNTLLRFIAEEVKRIRINTA